MSCYLIKVVEQYRCDTEAEAEALINAAKEDGQYTVVKSSSVIKTTKSKGEVIDDRAGGGDRAAQEQGAVHGARFDGRPAEGRAEQFIEGKSRKERRRRVHVGAH